jgi:hypothetical protein
MQEPRTDDGVLTHLVRMRLHGLRHRPQRTTICKKLFQSATIFSRVILNSKTTSLMSIEII